jgi:quinol monooxygenase YgiN
MTTLAIIARVELAEGDAEKYIEGARKLVAPTRQEAGCELYGFGVDPNEPNVVWISEQWASKAHLDDHLRAPHVQEFMAFAATLDIRAMDARQYTVDTVGTVELPE